MSRSTSELTLVTGAASGIGKATAVRLLRDGPAASSPSSGRRVLALDRNADGLAAAEKEFGRSGWISVCFDLAHTGRIPGLVRDLVQRHGAITRLVNNAGIWPSAPIFELTDETWELTQRVNVTAPLVLTRELAPVMRDAGGGAIVNIASRNAFRSSAGNAAYDASKAALAALTRTAAGELARHGIRVNAVCPGVIATSANGNLGELFMAAYRKIIPMNRFGRAEEVASVICFLLSDEASFITGETIVADGGQLACQDNQRFMEIPGLRP
jgi:NAD(P)-dependent dehydrogenase (short-subunit alcohol dehydrogenase family)